VIARCCGGSRGFGLSNPRCSPSGSERRDSRSTRGSRRPAPPRVRSPRLTRRLARVLVRDLPSARVRAQAERTASHALGSLQASDLAMKRPPSVFANHKGGCGKVTSSGEHTVFVAVDAYLGGGIRRATPLDVAPKTGARDGDRNPPAWRGARRPRTGASRSQKRLRIPPRTPAAVALTASSASGPCQGRSFGLAFGDR